MRPPPDWIRTPKLEDAPLVGFVVGLVLGLAVLAAVMLVW